MSSTLYFSCRLSSFRPLASHSTPHAAFLFFPALYSHSKASATFRMLLLRLRRSFSLSLYSSNTVACRLLKEHSVEGIPYSYLDGHEPEKRRTDGRTEDVSLFSDPISAVPCHRTITSGANRGKEREIASTTAGMHSWDRRGRKKQILYLPTVPHGRKMAAKTSIVIGSRSGERANASASNIYVHVTLGFFFPPGQIRFSQDIPT